MSRNLASSSLLLTLLAACAAQTPEPVAPSGPPPDETRVEVIKEPGTAEPETPPPPPPAAPDPLAQERAQFRAEHEADVARFTPELRAQAKALAERSYPNLRAGLTPILKSAHRRPGHAERDQQRHPIETLELMGVTPKQTVLEYGPGEGWVTELLAPLLAKQGKLLATSADPNGPADLRPTMYAQRFQWLLETAPELYGKVQLAIYDPKAPSLPADGSVDTVLLFRGLHGMVNQGTLQAWLSAFHGALKDKGVLGVEQHRAKPDADPLVSAKQGYLPEAWVVSEIEKAGFKLVKKSEINANPKDTKDYPEGVWTLPPTYRLGDVDRAKYTAIGESDRMTLRFVKVASKATAAPAPAAAAPAAPAAAAAGGPAPAAAAPAP
jgi:predicted methyltransferase